MSSYKQLAEPDIIKI